MKLFLNGGGSGSQTVLAYQEINKIIDHNKPVLYIPLAMEESQYSLDECYEWIKGELKILNVPNIEMVRSFEELFNKNFYNYSLLFFGGGRTCKLLKGLKEAKCFEKLQEFIYNDGVVYGSSAGAVIFGKKADSVYIMDKNDYNLDDTRGFNLLEGASLFVHYTNYRPRYSKEENKTLTQVYTDFILDYIKNNERIIALPEEDTIFYDGDNMRIIGESPYYVFDGEEKNKVYKKARHMI